MNDHARRIAVLRELAFGDGHADELRLRAIQLLADLGDVQAG